MENTENDDIDMETEYDDLERDKEVEECEKRATKKLAILLNNPRVQIKKLRISITLGNQLGALFESLNHQIHVEFLDYLQVPYLGCLKLVNVLPHLKPGVLENICFYYADYQESNNYNLEELSELEQWKQAKEFESNNPFFGDIEKLFHFDRLDTYAPHELDPDTVLSLKDIYMNSPTFEKCILGSVDLDVEEIRRKLCGDRFPMADGTTLHVEVTREAIFFRKK